MRRTGDRTPLPEVPEITEAEIVGQVRTDGSGESRYKVGGLLWTCCVRCSLPFHGAWEKTADVGLSIDQLREAIVTIAGHELPLIAEVVIETDDPEVSGLRKSQVGQITLRISTIDHGAGGVLRIIGQRHGFPDLTDDRVEPETARVTQRAAAHGRLIGGPLIGNGRRVQVIRRTSKLDDPEPQQLGWHTALEADGIGKAHAFVIQEEVGLAAPELGSQRSAKGSTKAIAMRVWQRSSVSIDERMIVFP